MRTKNAWASAGLALACTLVSGNAVAAGTKIYAAAAKYIPGSTLQVNAVLMSSSNLLLSGKPVKIDVRLPTTNGLLKRCTLTTSSKGRASCYVNIPNGESRTLSVTASFAGGNGYSASTRTTAVPKGSSVGRLIVPYGAVVNMAPVKADTSRNVVLRAKVTKNNAAVTSGKVRFLSNGVYLGLVNVSSRGWATLSLKPSSLQLALLKPITVGGTPARLGPVQAWFEPSGSSSVRTGARFNEIRWVQPADLCTSIGTGPTSSSAPCHVVGGSRQLTHTRRGKVTIQSPTYGASGATNVRPRISLKINKPSNPPPDPECNPSRAPAGACSRSCSIVDYVVLGDEGLMHSLTKVNSCNSAANLDLTIPPSALREAHYRCDLRAQQLGRSSWHHSTTASFKARVVGAFRYRDPKTIRVAGGWRVQVNYETKAVVADVHIPIDVACR